MLRMPKFELERPASLAEALELLADASVESLIVAGGTDLLPNLKHELFTPARVVSLERLGELRGMRELEGGWLAIGSMTRLDEVAGDARLAARAPALAQACSLVAGPQLRTMGTLGGNVLLDTRCQWYNQTYFWRAALGFCLKKDGSVCHVVEGGAKCVAAASNDSAPALMTLGAELVFVRAGGRRVVPIADLWLADGAMNKKLESGEILTEIRLPPRGAGHRGAYGKLRERGSIDFPLLGVAARLELDAQGAITEADLVLGALAARPVRVRRVAEELAGLRASSNDLDAALGRVAQLAYKQCHPLPNVPGDHEWRREMVPVYVRRTLDAALARQGPVRDA
ncbi:MAG: FAD binding domain-containing protein [Planctomycetes bacterium]|nr:FAD binding domain-containing protein [Planctomycetota bacterium]